MKTLTALMCVMPVVLLMSCALQKGVLTDKAQQEELARQQAQAPAPAAKPATKQPAAAASPSAQAAPVQDPVQALKSLAQTPVPVQQDLEAPAAKPATTAAAGTLPPLWETLMEAKIYAETEDTKPKKVAAKRSTVTPQTTPY